MMRAGRGIDVGPTAATKLMGPAPTRLTPRKSPRDKLVPMPNVPQGGGAINLPNGLQIICRYEPEPPPDPPPKHTFSRRFDDASYEVLQPDTCAVGSDDDMVKELREALLAQETMMRVTDMFKQYDLNGNGKICKEEFRKALPLLGLRGYARSDMDLLFDKVDTDHSDQIEYAELWRLLRHGQDIRLSTPLQAGAVAFDVRAKGASANIRRTPFDERFESSRPQTAAPVETMREALKKNRKRVIDAFRCLDKNGDGAITRREFYSALPVLGFTSNKEVSDAVFAEIDVDNSGSIEYEELNKKLRQGQAVSLAPELKARADASDLLQRNKIALRSTARGNMDSEDEQKRLRAASVAELRASLAQNRTRVIDMFRACDVNADGTVTKKEFRAALPLMGFGAGGRSSIDELFNTFDLDGSGTLDLKELTTVLKYEERKWRESQRALDIQ